MRKIETLSSPANPLLKDVRRAIAQGTPTADGCCVAESFHLLHEAERSGCEVRVVLASESAVARVGGSSHRLIALPDAVFARISGTEATQGVIALVRPPTWTPADLFRTPALVVVLDGVQDPGNAGSIMRSAEAFGATGVLFLKGSVGPFHPKTLRASAGSVFRVPVVSGMDAAAGLALATEHGLRLYAGAPHSAKSQSLLAADLSGAVAIVIGSEGQGLSATARRACEPLSIPTRGVESLNAGIAAAVFLYEASRQRTSEKL